ncbi:hypothetical protein [Geitlerinema sp. PCC 9228]|uniref:hypothetical protein n=1 Tax=Geitlerinema sp. PCC 9228 TaxID=111611 RepID=UPI001480CF29|nr:hypothetical protein [Geitlerinema sp. PCC 9228]
MPRWMRYELVHPRLTGTLNEHFYALSRRTGDTSIQNHWGWSFLAQLNALH